MLNWQRPKLRWPEIWQTVTRDSVLAKPKFIDDEAYRCLRAGDFEGFERHIIDREAVDFSDADLRGLDLRRVDPSKLLLRGAYLRDADLRGVDLRHIDLEGCSLMHAKVSGTYFPANVSPQELQMSLEHGTRLRATGESELSRLRHD